MAKIIKLQKKEKGEAKLPKWRKECMILNTFCSKEPTVMS